MSINPYPDHGEHRILLDGATHEIRCLDCNVVLPGVFHGHTDLILPNVESPSSDPPIAYGGLPTAPPADVGTTPGAVPEDYRSH